VAEFVVVLVEEDEDGNRLELAVEVVGDEVLVLVALKEAELDAHGFRDAGGAGRAAGDVGAPVLADDREAAGAAGL
jgi:hypothetical protein